MYNRVMGTPTVIGRTTHGHIGMLAYPELLPRLHEGLVRALRAEIEQQEYTPVGDIVISEPQGYYFRYWGEGADAEAERIGCPWDGDNATGFWIAGEVAVA